MKNDHQLKTDGFYKLSRRPSYTFAMLTFVGLGLTLNNWLSFFIVIVPAFIAFRYRIFVEEKA